MVTLCVKISQMLSLFKSVKVIVILHQIFIQDGRTICTGPLTPLPAYSGDDIYFPWNWL